MKHKMVKASIMAMMMWPALLSAQTGAQDDSGSSSTLSSSSTTTTTTAVTVGGIILTVVTLTPGAASANLQLYLQHNQAAVLMDTTTGGGHTMRDLAQAFAIEPAHLLAFSKILKNRRQDIRQLIGGKVVTQAHAMALIHLIVKDMSAQPKLKRSVQLLKRPRS